MNTAAAIKALEDRRSQLTDGLNSISEQQERIERTRQSLDDSIANLARDKAALIEIENALSILRAGESA